MNATRGCPIGSSWSSRTGTRSWSPGDQRANRADAAISVVSTVLSQGAGLRGQQWIVTMKSPWSRIHSVAQRIPARVEIDGVQEVVLKQHGCGRPAEAEAGNWSRTGTFSGGAKAAYRRRRRFSYRLLCIADARPS